MTYFQSKFINLILFFFLAFFTTTGLAANTTKWSTNWGEMVIIQEGSEVTGTYELDGGKHYGTMQSTSAGLIYKGWWREEGNKKECGNNSDWSGTFTITFDRDYKTYTSTWGYCEYNGDEPRDDWSGSLTEGTLTSDFTDTSATTIGCSSSSTASVALNLDIKIPSATYESLGGTSNIWVELEYKGVDSDGDYIWKLKNYGVNQ